MIIVMDPNATPEDIEAVDKRLQSFGFRTIPNEGETMTVIAAIGDNHLAQPENLASMKGIKQILPIQEPYKFASRETHPKDTVVTFPNGVKIGGNNPFAIMAGPCSVEEDAENLLKVAQSVKDAGATFLRGGAYKPRTSPYDFQGLEEAGLVLLAKARDKTGLLIVTEVMDTQEVPLVADYADLLQVGARNMQNFKLLKALGKQNKPVLLKRGLSATIKEFLLAAEHIMYQGNTQVILCERGIKGFDQTYTRNVLDIAAVPVTQKLSHLPIIIDPSHASGHRYLIKPLAKAAVVVGAHGLMCEVHHNPDKALSDGQQSLTIEGFQDLTRALSPLYAFRD
jgi:3-deoxy-7-phosphoheptulonate synthase